MDQGKRLDQLVRGGMMPAANLPILKRAIARVQMGSPLQPREREVIKTFMDELMYIVFGDEAVFQKAKQHTMKNKYQTEEQIVEQLDEKLVDGVEIVDGEEGRAEAEKKASKLGRKSKSEKMLGFAKSLKKEKERTAVDEQLLKINEDYQAKFEEALKHFEVDNIRDLPEDKKKEFFQYVDSQHDTDGEKIHAYAAESNAPFDGGKPIPKVRKDQFGNVIKDKNVAKNLAKKGMATVKEEDEIEEAIKLKGFGPDGEKGNMGNPVARASLMKSKPTTKQTVKKRVSDMNSSEKTANDSKRKEYNEYQKSKRNEEVEADVETMIEANEGDMCSCCDSKIDSEGSCGCDSSCDHCGGKHDMAEAVDKNARLNMIRTAARNVAKKSSAAKAAAEKSADAAAISAAKSDYKKSSKRGLAPVKYDESFDYDTLTVELIEEFTKAEAYRLIDAITKKINSGE